MTIRGLVSDDRGPVPFAEIEATDEDGRLKATATAEQDGHFQITIPPTAPYPLLLVAKLPNGKELLAVVTSNQVVEQDISPYTDLVVKNARQLGGLTPGNIAKAAGAAINMRPSQGGKRSSTGFKGDLTKQYGGWH
ncbi:MAG TPA: carboxypeptidase regulatory-like domain-containing protein [Methylothermaceae bacterium]|nr:carboxypeptidase regulatory-like domain-containing protein [Methylothermaceae bacterium]